MSYMFSDSLQSAVYQRLADDVELVGLIGAAIFDAPVEGLLAPSETEYVTLGEEMVRPNNTKTSQGAIHDFDVTVYSGKDGFLRAKQVASSICASLVDARLTLAAGHLVALRFLRAKAERGPSPVKRKITLRFRAVIDQQ